MTLAGFTERVDFDDAERGFIGALDPPVISNDEGVVVWDGTAYALLEGDCPDTANPSLWRQSQLCEKHGLYEVTEGIYQVRNYDVSNMTIVEGERGVIVIDPLISCECARTAFDLYRRHRGVLDGVELDGDPTVIARLRAVLDRPDPSFPIVTP